MVSNFLSQFFRQLGLSEGIIDFTIHITLGTGVILLGLIGSGVARLLLNRVVTPIVRRSNIPWANVLVEQGGLNRLTPLVAWLIISLLAPFVGIGSTIFGDFILRTLQGVFVGLLVVKIGVILDGANKVYESYPVSRQRPIKGYIQLVKIFLFILGAILLVTAMLDISPLAILSGFGAMSAVILLLFKDTLLGLVSGVQLSSNDMVRLGDWIEMPKYGADGEVIDITLQTVMVQNWDMTITTIPVYALISDSFKNWRGMSEGGGRRMKRSLFIDALGISFLSRAQIQKLASAELLGSYIREKIADIKVNPGSGRNGDISRRRLTNLGTFRQYASEYLQRHPGINHDMTCMVRQLQSTPMGVPIELYAFTREKAWIAHERLQSDIFDHLISVLPFFGLRLYQYPSAGVEVSSSQGLPLPVLEGFPLDRRK